MNMPASFTSLQAMGMQFCVLIVEGNDVISSRDE